MTLTDLQKLAETPEGREQIRVMVAEMMGFKSEEHSGYADGMVWRNPLGFLYGPTTALPDYTGDLNRIAQCEQGLSDWEHHQFRVHLWAITDPERDSETKVRLAGWEHNRAYISASALHRAIALILTKQPTKGAE